MTKGLWFIALLCAAVHLCGQTPAQTTLSSPTPQISNQSPKADSPKWYSDSAWWLVIIGAATAFVIGWQSFETRRAAQASRDSVALFRSKERAQLTIKVSSHRWRADSSVVSPIHAPNIQFRVTNFGSTHAFNVRLLVSYLISSSDSPAALPSFQEIDISSTIRANFKDSQPVLHPTIKNSIDELGGLMGGTKFMQVAARLTYTDVFGEQRETRMRSICRNDGTRSQWTEHGEPSENDAT